MAHEYCVSSCVHGHHIYQDVWSPVVRETLSCIRETNNDEDRHAIAVFKQGSVVGHLPRRINKLCSIFIRRGGTIEVTVSGSRRHSRDLPQRGLEVPCEIKFKIEHAKELEKLKKLMKKYELR